MQEQVSDDDSLVHKYTGQEYDKETGYYAFKHRYYDPVISRWISADDRFDGMTSSKGLDVFAYCGNNPVIFNDPTGHNRDKPLPANRQKLEKMTQASTQLGGMVATRLKAMHMNADTGKKGLVKKYTIWKGDNLTAIAQGLNEYYTTDIYTPESITSMNPGKVHGKNMMIKAGDTLNVDPADYLWDKVFSLDWTNKVPTPFENLHRDKGLKGLTDAMTGAPSHPIEPLTESILNLINSSPPGNNVMFNWWENYKLPTYDDILRYNYQKDVIMDRTDRINRYKNTIHNYWRDTNFLPDVNWRY